jgi:hypothetical protein
MQAMDELARQITGNPQYFWLGAPFAGGDQLAFKRALEKEAKRRKPMGLHIPVRAVRIQGSVT